MCKEDITSAFKFQVDYGVSGIVSNTRVVVNGIEDPPGIKTYE